MIQGVHGMFFTEEAEAARAFIRDVLEFEHVDSGDGWLIFDVPEAEVGVHPIEPGDDPRHELSFWCEDIEETVEKLTKADVETAPIEDRGYGLVTYFELPGGVPVELYEPTHPQP